MILLHIPEIFVFFIFIIIFKNTFLLKIFLVSWAILKPKKKINRKVYEVKSKKSFPPSLLSLIQNLTGINKTFFK